MTGAIAAPAARSRLDRVYAAVPLSSIFVWLVLLFAWEALGHKTPWLFIDELQLGQLSRSIWETGHPARRGVPFGFQTLYSYVLAPAWAFGGTATAYTIIKYAGIVIMTSVVFPAYFLARLVVSKPAALVVA